MLAYLVCNTLKQFHKFLSFTTYLEICLSLHENNIDLLLLL